MWLISERDVGCGSIRDMVIDVVKVFVPAVVAFFVGISLEPFLAHYFYKYKAWKRSSRSDEGDKSEDFKKIHNYKSEISTPRIGGVLIWLSVLITISIFWLVSHLFPSDLTLKFEFLSRSQTWLPLFTLIAGSLVGLVDDMLQIYGRGRYLVEGLSLRKRILLVLGISSIGAWWFFYKLGISSVVAPFLGQFELGFFFIPFFMLTMVAVFSGSILDGIDGLAGGVMAVIFTSYAVIAFFQSQIDLAAFCALIVGSILAFLWFNIPPARFYMGETGMLGLTVTLTVVAFLTDAVIVLPIIAFPLFAASASSFIQIVSKKYFNKKIFLVAPIHHHFEALGWPSYKVTMRFWIISVVFAIIGTVVVLVG